MNVKYIVYHRQGLFGDQVYHHRNHILIQNASLVDRVKNAFGDSFSKLQHIIRPHRANGIIKAPRRGRTCSTYCSHKFHVRIYTRRKFKNSSPLFEVGNHEKKYSIKITVKIVSHFQTGSFTLNRGPRCGPRRGSPRALIYDTQPRRSRRECEEKEKKESSRNHPRWEEGISLALGNRLALIVDESLEERFVTVKKNP